MQLERVLVEECVVSGRPEHLILRQYGEVKLNSVTPIRLMKQFAGLSDYELRELRQLQEENSRLKRLVADLSLAPQILQEIVSNKL